MGKQLGFSFLFHFVAQGNAQSTLQLIGNLFSYFMAKKEQCCIPPVPRTSLYIELKKMSFN